MQNSFIPDAIEIVSRAITADNEGDYDKALSLYRDALSRFTIGLKYEKNESKKVCLYYVLYEYIHVHIICTYLLMYSYTYVYLYCCVSVNLVHIMCTS